MRISAHFYFWRKNLPKKKTGIKTRNWIQLNWLVFVKLLSKWNFDRFRHVVFFGVVWRQFNRFFDFNVVQCQLFNRKYDSIYLVTTTKFQHLKKTTKKKTEHFSFCESIEFNEQKNHTRIWTIWWHKKCTCKFCFSFSVYAEIRMKWLVAKFDRERFFFLNVCW